GKVLEEHEDYVLFLQSYGVSGSASAKIPRRRILRIESVSNAPPDVPYRDVRFKMENPELNYYRRPPYSILTDESFFRVEHTVTVLQELHREFMKVFGPLIQDESRGDSIQVLFFNREDAYKKYQQQLAPNMSGSSGFYSPQIDRLIVFNQGTSVRIAKARSKVETEYKSFLATHSWAEARSAADRWKAETEQQVEQWAESQTQATIRHEGAHQLFFGLGVHSMHHIEGEWLVEGLATYCETPVLGSLESSRTHILREAVDQGRLIPFEHLIRVPNDSEGFDSFATPAERELAYSESWALVLFFMQEAYQPRFFDYLRYLRNPDNFSGINQVSPPDLLARYAGLSKEELWEEWLLFLNRL
ncbi:MAG: DUF1570 domain-containing protein, partial [Lentisphaerota bacterium]